jgi:hypothetical protein
MAERVEVCGELITKFYANAKNTLNYLSANAFRSHNFDKPSHYHPFNKTFYIVNEVDMMKSSS